MKAGGYMKMVRTSMDTANLTAWLLRLGLAAVFLYAALGSLTHPSNWIGYLPQFMTTVVDAGLQLKLIAIVQLVLVAWLISGVWLRYAALLAAAMLGGILVFNLGVLDVTFRDIGLVFAALALAAATWQQGSPHKEA